VLFIIVSAWYSYSGLAKIIDIGPHWPIVLHLENLASVGIKQSLFLHSDFRFPFVSSLFQSFPLSVLGGFITLIAEGGFISILFLPRYRLFFVGTMILFHSLVFLMHGINFLGNSLIMLLCLDWNVLVRRATVYYDEECGFCQRSLHWINQFDWFGKMSYKPISALSAKQTEIDVGRLQHAMGVQDENGEIYYGADGFEQISSRCPALIGFSLLMKIPGCIYVARYVYNIIARNRMKLGCRPDGGCQLPSGM
jgi:predicted DCC family thiol-disulfide oxidoreductase YuxK